ncbi:MAG: Stp1/IreP family PP2C-type Ser/Thr phosphatase [Lachnospiraceae bacterium]|nr:Stp1/IreP family PP2C-type Ser/Thr phosphatase [Lachnospiraceae bacterium]
MRLSSYSVTDVGRTRKQNEDFVFTSEVPVGNLPDLFIVADGMGGHRAGEFASKTAVETMVDTVNLSKDTSVVRVMSKGVERANRKVRERSIADESFAGMGTTLVACSYDGELLTVANIGDSRLYVSDGKGLRQITVDHSLVEEMVRMGELDRKDARLHPDKNIITRAVGVQDYVDADFFEVEDLHPGDMILMCSDGLSNMLDDAEMAGILSGDGDVRDKAKRLVAAANMNGGKDNIAVVLIRIEDEVKA